MGNNTLASAKKEKSSSLQALKLQDSQHETQLEGEQKFRSSRLVVTVIRRRGLHGVTSKTAACFLALLGKGLLVPRFLLRYFKKQGKKNLIGRDKTIQVA